MLAQFFAERSDHSKSLLVQKLKDILESHFEGPITLEELLFVLHNECLFVQESFAEAPSGKAGEHFIAGLQHYLEALYMLGRELEANGELSDETEQKAIELTAQADRFFSDYEFEASQDANAEQEA